MRQIKVQNKVSSVWAWIKVLLRKNDNINSSFKGKDTNI